MKKLLSLLLVGTLLAGCGDENAALDEALEEIERKEREAAGIALDEAKEEIEAKENEAARVAPPALPVEAEEVVKAPEEKIAGSDGKTLAEFLPGKKIYFWSPPPGESVQKNKRPNSVLQFGKDGPWDMGMVFSDEEVFPLSELPETLAKQAYAVDGLQVELSGEMMTGTIAFSSPNPRKGEEMVLGREGHESVTVTISWIAEAGSPLPDAHQFDSQEEPDATVRDDGQSQRPKPTAKDKPIKASIFDATILGWVTVVKQHVDAGSDLNEVTPWGATALDLAIEEKQTEIADLLRKHGAKTGEEMQAEEQLKHQKATAAKIRLAKERNATELHLDDYDQITDLTPLAGLTKLTSLTLVENNVTDLSPLSGLTNLTSLSLRENQITDVTPLSGLTNLRSLYLSKNQMTDLTSLAELSKLSKLSSLELDDNQITDLKPLAGLTNLRYLHLSKNQIADLTPLAELSKLRSLYLDDNQITDLKPLAGLTNLRSLYLSKNQIADEQQAMLKKALPNCKIRF